MSRQKGCIQRRAQRWVMILRYVLLQGYASNSKRRRVMVSQVCAIAGIRIETADQTLKAHHQLGSIEREEEARKSGI